MLNTPIARIAYQFLAGFVFMNLFREHPEVAKLVTLLAGLLAAAIYMLRYEAEKMAHLYAIPNAKPWIEFVCRVCREPLPAPHPAGAQKGENNACPSHLV